MYTNTPITLYLYNNGTYTRQVIDKAFWSDSRQSNYKSTGLTTTDSVKVMIPTSNTIVFTTPKDMVVKGVITFEVDNTSEQTKSASQATLKKTYNAFTVSMADDKRYGRPTMHHYDLSLK